MAKPKIIIADSDKDYVIPIQYKFIEEFFEKVDIEVITEESYFNQYFAEPKKAEILIISEDLYDSSVLRHDIGHIFLMTEQYTEEATAQLNVSHIYKYTSIKEIFTEIIGKSQGALRVHANEKKEPQIILVTSACGGVGKTTVALGISSCLTKNYKKVLYINADRLQHFQHLLDNKTPITALDVYARFTNRSTLIFSEIKHIIRKEQFSYIPPFKSSLMSLGISYMVFSELAVAAKKSKEFDYIVVDADIAFDDFKAELLNVADKVIIVTKQDMGAVYATNVMASNINGLNSEKYLFVCNDFNRNNANALVSSEVSVKFAVNEYVEHFSDYSRMKPDDFSNEKGIQKTAFLII